MIRATRTLPIVLTLVAGFFLIRSAEWRLRAELEAAGTKVVYQEIKQREAVSLEDLTASNLALGVASKANPNSSIYLAELADLALRKARLSSESATNASAQQFEISRELSQHALSKGPSDPYAWYMLAYSEQALTGLSDEALRYLTMSFETGTIEGQLLVSRISFCFAYWSRLPEHLKDQALQQIDLALNHYQLVMDLADYTVSLGPQAQRDFIELVETASADDTEDLNRFTYWVRVKKAAAQNSAG